MTVTKTFLSSSVNGKQILITTTTGSAATNIHTAVAGTSSIDEIWLYASNSATASITCSILWGGTNIPTDLCQAIINPNAGKVLLIDGALLQNALTVQAYASVAGWIAVSGFVNRVS